MSKNEKQDMHEFYREELKRIRSLRRDGHIDRLDFLNGARLLGEALEHAGTEAAPAANKRLRERPDTQARRLAETL